MASKSNALRIAELEPQHSPLTDGEAAKLINRILPVSGEDDGPAKALAYLINHLASNEDMVSRENDRETLFRHVFCNSYAHLGALMDFLDSAGVHEA